MLHGGRQNASITNCNRTTAPSSQPSPSTILLYTLPLNQPFHSATAFQVPHGPQTHHPCIKMLCCCPQPCTHHLQIFSLRQGAHFISFQPRNLGQQCSGTEPCSCCCLPCLCNPTQALSSKQLCKNQAPVGVLSANTQEPHTILLLLLLLLVPLPTPPAPTPVQDHNCAPAHEHSTHQPIGQLYSCCCCCSAKLIYSLLPLQGCCIDHWPMASVTAAAAGTASEILTCF